MIREIERNGCIFYIDEEHPFRRFGGGGKGGGGGKVAMPKAQAKRIAPAASGQEISETARKNKNRAAAFQPRGFAPPSLGQPALLGSSRL